MQDIDIESCHGVDSLRCNLESVEIHRTVPRMKVPFYNVVLLLLKVPPFISLLL